MMTAGPRSLWNTVKQWKQRRRDQRERAQWERAGRPAPPPHCVKREIVADYAERFGCESLVETGTFLGDMVAAMRGQFDHIYSIELSPQLYVQACARFRGCDDVHLFQGDSDKVLGRLAPRLDQKTLFWLDGHYSGGATALGDKETPILEELSHVMPLMDLGHVVLIDDAREFGADPAYPTVDELRQFVAGHNRQLEVANSSDVIRITPVVDAKETPLAA